MITCSVLHKKILCLYKYRHLEPNFIAVHQLRWQEHCRPEKLGIESLYILKKIIHQIYIIWIYKIIYWSYQSPDCLTQVGIFLLKTVFVTSRKKIQDNLRPCIMQEDRLNTGLKCHCLLAFKSVNHQSETLFNWLSSLQGRMWGFSLCYLNTDTVQKVSIMFIVYTLHCPTILFPSLNLINSDLPWIQKINIQIFQHKLKLWHSYVTACNTQNENLWSFIWTRIIRVRWCQKSKVWAGGIGIKRGVSVVHLSSLSKKLFL